MIFGHACNTGVAGSRGRHHATRIGRESNHHGREPSSSQASARFAANLDEAREHPRPRPVRHLLRSRGLSHLALDHSPLSDEGLRYLGQLPNLNFLRLDSTGITDDGLAHLSRSTSLGARQTSARSMKQLSRHSKASLAAPIGSDLAARLPAASHSEWATDVMFRSAADLSPLRAAKSSPHYSPHARRIPDNSSA
jgi:hypothetical protein